MRQLTKQEIEEVIKNYDLGEFKSIKYLKGGWISYIFLLTTSRGKFIVRKLGYQLDNEYWIRQKEIEYLVLDYLQKNDFSYKTPEIMKTKNNSKILHNKEVLFEVYPQIKGKQIDKPNLSQHREAMKCLAEYHKIIKNFHPPKRFIKEINYEWMFEKFAAMRKVKVKEEVDKLMLRNIDFFESLLKRLTKEKIEGEYLTVHGDFSVHNLLFDKNKVAGILDFENLSWSPKTRDVAYVLRDNVKKNLIEEYKKYNSLSNEEIKTIEWFISINFCNAFWFIHLGMKKRKELRYKELNKLIKRTKKFMKVKKIQ